MNNLDYFEFTKKDYDHIVEECMLDEEYAKLLEYKIKGYSIIQISMQLGMSESTVKRKVKQLTRKIIKIL